MYIFSRNVEYITLRFNFDIICALIYLVIYVRLHVISSALCSTETLCFQMHAIYHCEIFKTRLAFSV
jgi:hypothetical protein